MYDLFFIVQGVCGKFAIIFPLSVPYGMSRAERTVRARRRPGGGRDAGRRGCDTASDRTEAVFPADGCDFSRCSGKVYGF